MQEKMENVDYGKKYERETSVIDLQSVTASNIKLTETGYEKENGNTASHLDEVYDPFSNRDTTHPTSDFGALVHLFKGSFGSGILAVPSAFKSAGLLVGLVGTMLVGMLCAHCVAILVKCSHVLSVRDKKPSLTFGDTAEVAFRTGPKEIRKYSKAAKKFVTSALFSTYFFGNTVYIVLISEAFKEILDAHFGIKLNIRWYILLVTIPLIPLGIGRTLKYLVPVSAFGILFIIFGLTVTLYNAFQDLPSISGVKDLYVSKLDQMPLFFSTIVFAMEGIGTVLPIENSMKNPDHFRGFCGVLNIAMTLIVLLYCSLGFICYLKYGNDTKANITLNLPDDALSQSVKILVALSILFTYGLQFCVPAEIMWNKIKHKVSSSYESAAYYSMRGLMILGTVALALAIPNLGPIIGLVGALCLATLGLWIPAAIETITYWEEPGNSIRLTKNIFIMLFSLMTTVAGTYVSIGDIVKEYLS